MAVQLSIKEPWVSASVAQQVWFLHVIVCLSLFDNLWHKVSPVKSSAQFLTGIEDAPKTLTVVYRSEEDHKKGQHNSCYPQCLILRNFNHRNLMSSKLCMHHQTVMHNPIETQNEQSRP